MAKYDGTCWECQHLQASKNWNNPDVNGSRREIRCDALYYGVNPYQKKCSRFDKGYYSDRDIKEFIEAFNKKCNYYIVSACMGITQLPNSCVYLDAFSDAVNLDVHTGKVVSLLKLMNYTPDQLLADYEIYGKLVADALYASYNNPETKEATYNYVMKNVIPRLNTLVEYQKKGNLRRLVVGYISLTRDLMNLYHIDYDLEANKAPAR